MFKKITAITLLLSMLFLLAGCDNEAKVMEGYGDYVAEVGKMTLVTDRLIEETEEGKGTAMGCTIFAEKDGEFKKIVTINGISTGFPIKYEEEVGFWYATPDLVQNLVFYDGVGVLEAAEFVTSEPDEKGELIYEYYDRTGVSQEVDEAKFDELLGKYNNAQPIIFEKKSK
ncbi:MAG: hypothetical protein IJN37_01455 [Clostridia bacterium]|nr:hypothetical protein [Clostridia bacterium]